MRRGVAVAAVLLLALAGCGGDGHHEDAAAGHDHDAMADAHDDSHVHSDDAARAFAFGAPGDPGAATLTVEITASDPYRFEPEDLEVGPGETVTFVVTNEGEQAHEFVLGDRDYQEAHEEQMAAGAMHHEGNAIMLPPGQTQELTWAFPT
ncbi:MAG: hypothetical protein M3271_06110, partial [Actinomycetota bacterium]|nr:hypothetical protein [Actinomycetota bacterium]